MKIAIFSAFPQETKQIIRNLKTVKRVVEKPCPLFHGEYSDKEVIVALTGMGGRNAEAVLDFVLGEYRQVLAISAGFGGALYQGSAIGEIVLASKVCLIDNGIGETLELPQAKDVFSRLPLSPAIRLGSILTLGRWRKKSEIKDALPTELPFAVCDMETYFLAKLSIKKGLPFLALRSITDRENEEIPPEFLSVSDESGQYRLSRALGLLLKPRLMREIAKIGRNAVTASNNLWLAVRSIIEVL